MVSFWPFKGQDTSAASFEKLLSSLSTKINKETVKNDSLRQKQRRYRVLWTLYTSFAYILAVLILTLVTGWQNWTAIEYTGLAGTPLVIYAVRTALDATYNYRLTKSQNQLNQLHKERDAAITKLKEATKYNTTQQLLEKYGGSPPKPAALKRKPSGAQNKATPSPRVARTGIPPPPTANIPGRVPPPTFPSAPHTSPPSPPSRQQQQQENDHPSDPQAEFAPNAFSAPAPAFRPAQDYASSSPRWFDRILDVVLGDDETQPKNRIVLICKNCRLVNGQAPPGTQSLDDVGPWRCMACQTLNASESPAKEMIQKIVTEEGDKHGVTKTKRRATTVDGAQDEHDSSDSSAPVAVVKDEDSEDDDQDSIVVDTAPPAASTRSKAKQRNK